MVELDNPFITKLYYAFESKFYLAFVMEFCPGGEIFYHLKKFKKMNEEDTKFYFI